MSSDFLNETWFIVDPVDGMGVIDGVSDTNAVIKLPVNWRQKWPDRYVVTMTKSGDVKRLPHESLALVIERPESDLVNECLTTEKPLIIYTGRMNEDEIYQLVEQIVDYKHGICLVHCMEMLPTPEVCVNMQFFAVLADILDDIYLDGCAGWCCRTPDLELCKAAISGTFYGNVKYIFYVKPDDSKTATPKAKSALTVSQFRELMHWTRRYVRGLWRDTALDDREDRRIWLKGRKS
jgi:hypothetical protein